MATVVDQLGAKASITLKDSFEKRKDAFVKEVDVVGNKYMVGIVPKITVTSDGIIPVLTFKDRRTPPPAPQKPPNKKEG